MEYASPYPCFMPETNAILNNRETPNDGFKLKRSQYIAMFSPGLQLFHGLDGVSDMHSAQ